MTRRKAVRKTGTNATNGKRNPNTAARPKKKGSKRKVSKNGLLRTALKLCIAGGVVGILAAGGFFLWADHRVSAKLGNIHGSSVPVIYSAPLDVAGLLSRLSYDEPNPEERIRAVLTARRYTENTTGAPSPGEFSVRNRRLVIATREFRQPSGEILPTKRIALSLDTGIADGAKRRDVEPIYLEPQPVSYIGSEEVRASTFTPLAEIPVVAQQAVIAIEDERFYDHMGVDLIGIARAIVKNVLARRLVQGGSTLTQQLAKNLFLSPKRTLSRKLMEVPTALSLERHLSKDKLLELYLNEVYLGQEGAVALHGMPQATSAYFGKKIQDITADEAATLAGIIKAPSYFAPRRHPERALERRNTVLAKMHELKFITDAEYATAVKRPLKIVGVQGFRRVAPYFTTALETELNQAIDFEAARSAGISIFTGLDLGIQECAENALSGGLEKIEKANPRLTKKGKTLEGALVAIDPSTGLVKAMVGGRDFGASQFNRALQATRQIGSTVKPFLYLTALDGSLNSYKVATAVSILEDKPMSIEMRRQATWVPENYDHSFRGDVTLRYALENSLNMPAIYVAQRVGVPALQHTLSAFEVAPSVPAVPALALGAVDTTPIRLTSAYGALANGGVHVEPRLYISAVSADGDKLATASIRENRVADERAVFVLTNILQGVVERGTAKVIRSRGFMRDAAGKTGTSDMSRDAWFVGYTPNLVVGVWVGFDDNTPIGLTGGASSAPIWAEMMKCSSPFVPNLSFSPPPGVTLVEVDRESGELAGPECPDGQRVREVFIEGTEPTQQCHLHSDGGTYSRPSEARLPDSSDGPGKAERGFWSTIFGE